MGTDLALRVVSGVLFCLLGHFRAQMVAEPSERSLIFGDVVAKYLGCYSLISADYSWTTS
jgi:hypothetical protein